MDPFDPTADDRQTALMQALKARMGGGQPQAENFLRGWGNLGLASGDRVLAAPAQAQIAQANNLGQAQERGRGQMFSAALESEREARRRKEQLSDTASMRAWTEKRDATNDANEIAKARILSGIRAEAERAPKAVPAGEAAQIGTYDTAVEAAKQLGQAWDADTGALSGIAQFIPGTDAKQYSNKADVAAQVIGGILEEGKLGEADLPRYKAMMPQPGDSKETKEKKLETIQQMIGLKRSGKIRGLGQAGFETRGFPTTTEAPQQGGGMDPTRRARLEELRRKRDAGALK